MSRAARLVVMSLAAIAFVLSSRASTQEFDGQFVLQTPHGPIGGGVPRPFEPPMPDTRTRAGDPQTLTALPFKYSFFPQAGVLWQDLFPGNFVDKIAGTGFQDYECTGYTYDGHNAHDVALQGFQEQAIGVPVFAAVAGDVIAVHDGEPDMNTDWNNPNANFVAIDHSDGFVTYYYHLKKNSISVAVNDIVVAGRQIGLTGSSGMSTWPHLHFQSNLNGAAIEPNAGSCNPGPTNWSQQAAFRRELYVRSFVFGSADFTGLAGFPWDQAPRKGAYVHGTNTIIYFRFSFAGLPANSTYQLMVTRPDNSPELLENGPLPHNTVFAKDGWYWFARQITLEPAGDWLLTLGINNGVVATAPFRVVATPAEIVNRPPLVPQSVTLEKATANVRDPATCRVTPLELFRQDPDYDLVRYNYLWRVNGSVVRDVTNAALSDMVPRGTRQAGQSLSCTVTPYDQLVAGPSITASVPLPFADPTLTAGVNQVRALHITELQSRINALRARWGLLAFSFSPITAGVTSITSSHIMQMRNALNEVYVATNINPTPVYSDAPLIAGIAIRAVHINELRVAVGNVE